MAVKKGLAQLHPRTFYQIFARASQILFPQCPCYYFPAYLLIQTYNKLVALRKNPRLRVIPLPNNLYNVLVQNERFQSDHFCIVSNETIAIYGFDKKSNWINIVFSAGVDSSNKRLSPSPDIVQTILTKPNASLLAPVIGVSICPKNCVLVSENCHQNWCSKNKIDEKHRLLVQLQAMTADQHLPRLATKSTIFLIKHPYELPLDVTDEIITNFFTIPRILYRNHTYEIELDEQQVGTTLYSQYFTIFHNLRKLYFRCVNLESSDYQFEHFGVVLKGATTLHQSTSMNYPVPRQYLDDLGLVSACPWGLMRHFNNLRACVLPFMGAHMLSPSLASSPAPNASDVSRKKLSNRIFPAFLLQSERGTGKHHVVQAVAQSLGFQLHTVNCAEIISAQIPAATEAKLKIALQRANFCEPTFFVLDNFEMFGVDNEGREDLRVLTIFQRELHNLFAKDRAYPLILIAMSNATITKSIIQSQFLETMSFEAPSKCERFNILQWLFHREIIAQEVHNGQRDNLTDIPLWNGRSMKTAKYQLTKHYNCAADVQILESVAEKTQGLLFGDLKLLFDISTKDMLTCRDADALRLAENRLNLDNFEISLNGMQSDFSDSLGAPKVPRVLWSDIGGLAKLKDEIQSSIGLPLKHVHLMGKNMRRSGILLYGPPGTGKTLVAKAVATECNLNFLAIAGPELLNMYVGQSEQNVREVFVRARSAAPCVIFLDELDSLAPNRGAAGDSGGVMDRVVSQLLAEMDCMSGNDADQQKQIFILAATNRPDLIDSALLRPGRFDKLLYVGPYVTQDDKAAVLTAQMKKFNLSKGVKITSIASLMKEDMTGADIYSVCSNAWLSAVRRSILAYQAKQDAGEEIEELNATDVVVNLDDFGAAIGNFVPSINQKDMEYFSGLRATYSLEQ